MIDLDVFRASDSECSSNCNIHAPEETKEKDSLKVEEKSWELKCLKIQAFRRPTLDEGKFPVEYMDSSLRLSSRMKNVARL